MLRELYLIGARQMYYENVAVDEFSLLFLKHEEEITFLASLVDLPRWKKHHPKKVAPRVGARGVTIVCDIEAYPRPDFQVGQLDEIATNDESKICQTAAWGLGNANPNPNLLFWALFPKNCVKMEKSTFVDLPMAIFFLYIPNEI